MHHAPRTTHHAPRTMHHAPCTCTPHHLEKRRGGPTEEVPHVSPDDWVAVALVALHRDGDRTPLEVATRARDLSHHEETLHRFPTPYEQLQQRKLRLTLRPSTHGSRVQVGAVERGSGRLGVGWVRAGQSGGRVT